MPESEVTGNFNLIGCYKKCNGPITDEISSIKLDLPVTYAIMREDAKGPTCILAITVRTLTSGHTT